MSKNITVKDIKQQLDNLEVKYDNSLDKDDLLKLLEEAKKKPPEENNGDDTSKTEEPKSYVAIHDFKDLEDNSYVYLKDDPYPRKGNKNVDEERIQELMSNQNKQGKQLIKEQD